MHMLVKALLTTMWLMALTSTTVGAPETGAAQPPAEESYCIQCHDNGDVWDKEQQRYFVSVKAVSGDIHWRKGLRCPDCHGGDPTISDVAAAHSKDAGFKSVKSPADIPAFCGNCHANIETMKRYQPSPRTDQLAEYWTSGHGKALKAKGDPKVATCVSCHGKPHGSGDDPGPHGIRAVADLDSPVYRTRVAKTCAQCHADEKHMAGYQYHGRPLGNQQYSEWRASVHGRALLDKGDLSAPTCNNCHGNHGAVPPEVGSVANACGTCHGKIADLFSTTRMKHRFEQEQLPGCATCHGSHKIQSPTDQLVGMEKGAFCVKCHEGGKYGATLAGAAAARTISSGFKELHQNIARADATLAHAERLGMEVSQPKFDLRGAVTALTNARTLLHSFQVKSVEVALAEGEKVVNEVQGRADHALEEHTYRRVWLAGSLVPILIVIGVLLFYIRTLPIAKQ